MSVRISKTENLRFQIPICSYALKKAGSLHWTWAQALTTPAPAKIHSSKPQIKTEYFPGKRRKLRWWFWYYCYSYHLSLLLLPLLLLILSLHNPFSLFSGISILQQQLGISILQIKHQMQWNRAGESSGEGFRVEWIHSGCFPCLLAHVEHVGSAEF